jgi:succinylglutamate desuccinylase
MSTKNTPAVLELDGIASGCPEVQILSIPGAYRVQSELPGVRLVISGIVHGHEPCGYFAIRRMLTELAAGDLKLQRGEVKFVIANPEAFSNGKRQIDHNLNRLFRDDLRFDETSVEHRRTKELADIYRGCDVLCDLHATTAPTVPFLMCERHLLNEARALGLSPIVIGWGELGDASVAGDTETFANASGGKGFTFECGQRDDVASYEVAYQTARRFLEHYGLVARSTVQSPPQPKAYELFKVVTLREADFAYSKAFANFDELEAGAEIGRDKQGSILAPEKCVIVMPAATANTKIGEDLFMLGRELR